MPATSPVTQINASYLNGLKSNLQELLDQVNQQLSGLGAKGVTSTTTSFIEPVTAALQVAAGASPFAAGAAFNQALKSMGGSVNDQLIWLKKVLTDMISEITTTVNSFSATESLNDESASQVASDFAKTISDLNTPGGSSSNPNTPATPNPNTPATPNPNTPKK
jgi:methyl-accepting chemotaxis protein